MTEYVFPGGRIPECQTTTCMDYIVNSAGSGPGFGVLAGGTADRGLAQSIARHVAQTLVVEGA
jgi:pyrroline-5-carboxylate reductase